MKTQTDEKGDTWGPWIAHDGTGCPVPRGTMVIVRHRDGTLFGPYPAQTLGETLDGRTVELGREVRIDVSSWHWAIAGNVLAPEDHIIAYRVRKPPGLVMLEEILREVEATHPLRREKPEIVRVKFPWREFRVG